jgi:hypothetical protein
MLDAPAAANVAREFQMIFQDDEEADKESGSKRRKSSTDDRGDGVEMSHRSIRDKWDVINGMQLLLYGVDVSAKDLFDIPAEEPDALHALCMSSSCQPLASLRPERVWVDENGTSMRLGAFFDIDPSGTVTFRPDETIRKLNNTSVWTHSLVRHLFRNKANSALNADNLMRISLPWVQPDTTRLAQLVRQMAKVAELEGADALPDELVVKLIANNRLATDKKPRHQVQDPLSVARHPIVDPTPPPSYSELEKSQMHHFPGIFRQKHIFSPQFSDPKGTAETRQQVALLAYRSLQELLGSQLGKSVEGVPEALTIMCQRVKENERTLAALAESDKDTYEDVVDYLTFDPHGGSCLAQMVERICESKADLGLLTTQLSAFILGVMLGWGIVLGDSGPIVVNIVLYGPAGGGKSEVQRRIEEESGLPCESQVYMSGRNGFYNTAGQCKMVRWDECPLMDPNAQLSPEMIAFFKTNLEANGTAPALPAAPRPAPLTQALRTAATSIRTVVDGPVGPAKSGKMGKVAHTQYSIDRSLKFFNANFRLPSEGTLGPINDRIEYLPIQAASLIDQNLGADEITKATAGVGSRPAGPVFMHGHRRIAQNSFDGLCIEHLIARPPTDMICLDLWLKFLKGRLGKMNTRRAARHRQLAEALEKAAVMFECAQPWPEDANLPSEPATRRLTREETALVVFANSLVLSPESIVLAHFLLLEDLSSFEWQDQVTRYVFSLTLQPNYYEPDDDQTASAVASENIVSFQTSPEGDMVTTFKSMKALGEAASAYLDRIPGMRNPGVDQIIKHVRGIPCADPTAKSVVMTTVTQVNKKGTVRTEQKVAINRSLVDKTHTPLMKDIIATAMAFWKRQPENERLVSAAGFPLLPYTTGMPEPSDRDFVAAANKVSVWDAAIIENPHAFTQKGIVKPLETAAKKLLAAKPGRNAWCYAVRVLETKRAEHGTGGPAPHLQFISASKVNGYRLLPDTASAANHPQACPHPTEQGRLAVVVQLYALAINPAAWEMAMEDKGADLSPEFTKRLVDYYQCIGVGDLEMQRERWDGIVEQGIPPLAFPVGVRTNNPRKPYAEVRAVDPDTIEPVEIADSRFTPADSSGRKWKPRRVLAAEKKRKDVWSEVYPGTSPTVKIKPGANIFNRAFKQAWDRHGFGLDLMLPSKREAYAKLTEEAKSAQPEAMVL